MLKAPTLPSDLITLELRSMAEVLFSQLREMSFDGVGISRETYGPSETAAMQVIEATARQHGLESTWDGARNLLIRLPGAGTHRRRLSPPVPIWTAYPRVATTTARQASSRGWLLS